MENLTPEQIKNKVLDQVYDSCLNDGDYLWNLIQWAHRDYKDEDYKDDFITMGLSEKESTEWES